MTAAPFENLPARVPAPDTDVSFEERGLANRNSGLPLELLRHDITPAGAHYLLTHFDMPHLPGDSFRLRIGGAVRTPLDLSLADLLERPQVDMPVTLECAGNGRAGHDPRHRSMPWLYEAVGTALWTGTPLAPLLAEAGAGTDVQDWAFFGADEGFDDGVRHFFGRSLTPAEVSAAQPLLVTGMNGAPLLPQHGAPLRLIVPGWYGMASVKWLNRIEALTERFDGFQQVHTYRYRQDRESAGTPVTTLRVKSLMVPPGLPDWYSRRRWLEAGPVTVEGRAWTGPGRRITGVRLTDGSTNIEADLSAPVGSHAWLHWRAVWDARPGRYQLRCIARDDSGAEQPFTPPADVAGFGNNAAQSVDVQVAPHEV